ncbi:uncharacterized protein LOC111633808 [Centruroides sculpturatus]|uniref:uncharacterized protein LOC111633808 n=1 Tax=Centruroides sculpturatus TaxID=218467 RepID=UPI000C6E620C|nr:uncharacterized protein LOC111633808 [Centruroides sculpturatus]
MYIRFIELNLRGFTSLVIWQMIPVVNEYAICIGWYDVFEINSMLFKIVFSAIFIIYCIAFEFIKRNKFNLKKPLRNKYFRVKMINENNILLQYVTLLISFVIIVAIDLYQITVTVFFYTYIEMKQKFNGEALFCSTFASLNTSFFIGGFGYILFLVALLVLISHKEFEQLSMELFSIKRIDYDIREKLNELMMHHEELWIFVQQFKSKYNFVFGFVYFGIVWVTSFSYYAFLFLELHYFIKLLILLLMILFTCFSIIFGCLLCLLAFTMENTFQDIRQFAGCDIAENQKLKILNFMKRFGKVSLCLTIGRFLIIDKRIPLKMAKTLHSVFSGFKKLKSISKEEQNCLQIYKINFTETN